jgi:hypothetical protein
MTFKTTALMAIFVLCAPIPALADVLAKDGYARVMGASAQSGAVFVMLENTSAEADRLIGARSDFVEKIELHTHMQGADGVMKMMEVEGGLELPASGSLALERGGNHLMLMGLKQPFAPGDDIALTLTFEKAGDVELTVPIDLTR